MRAYRAIRLHPFLESFAGADPQKSGVSGQEKPDRAVRWLGSGAVDIIEARAVHQHSESWPNHIAADHIALPTRSSVRLTVCQQDYPACFAKVIDDKPMLCESNQCGFANGIVRSELLFVLGIFPDHCAP